MARKASVKVKARAKVKVQAGKGRRLAPKRSKPKAAKAPAARRIRAGFISHTELASSDPAATKAWCESVLGWRFGPSMDTPAGPYHMWSFGGNVGGGIRANNPPEAPGSVPYCEVKDIHVAYEAALKAGGSGMVPPNEIPGGHGWIAIVQAPGGVAIGFWGTK